MFFSFFLIYPLIDSIGKNCGEDNFIELKPIESTGREMKNAARAVSSTSVIFLVPNVRSFVRVRVTDFFFFFLSKNLDRNGILRSKQEKILPFRSSFLRSRFSDLEKGIHSVEQFDFLWVFSLLSPQIFVFSFLDLKLFTEEWAIYVRGVAKIPMSYSRTIMAMGEIFPNRKIQFQQTQRTNELRT